jgi:hypothetical protein
MHYVYVFHIYDIINNIYDIYMYSIPHRYVIVTEQNINLYLSKLTLPSWQTGTQCIGFIVRIFLVT